MSRKQKKNKLLWIEDDPRERFVYEEYILTNLDNWAITWAGTVLEAMIILNRESFDAIILDQMLPIEKSINAPEVWGGCYLLHWLRNGKRITNRYLDNQLKRYPNPIHKKIAPLKNNKTTSLLIISAFYDEEVLKETRNASELDTKISLQGKPVEIELIRKILKKFLREGEKNA